MGMGMSLTLLPALETLFLILDCLLQPQFEDFCLVLLLCPVWLCLLETFFFLKRKQRGSWSRREGNWREGIGGMGKLWLECILWEKNLISTATKKNEPFGLTLNVGMCSKLGQSSCAVHDLKQRASSPIWGDTQLTPSHSTSNSTVTHLLHWFILLACALGVWGLCGLRSSQLQKATDICQNRPYSPKRDTKSNISYLGIFVSYNWGYFAFLYLWKLEWCIYRPNDKAAQHRADNLGFGAAILDLSTSQPYQLSWMTGVHR